MQLSTRPEDKLQPKRIVEQIIPKIGVFHIVFILLLLLFLLAGCGEPAPGPSPRSKKTGHANPSKSSNEPKTAKKETTGSKKTKSNPRSSMYHDDDDLMSGGPESSMLRDLEILRQRERMQAEKIESMRQSLDDGQDTLLQEQKQHKEMLAKIENYERALTRVSSAEQSQGSSSSREESILSSRQAGMTRQKPEPRDEFSRPNDYDGYQQRAGNQRIKNYEQPHYDQPDYEQPAYEQQQSRPVERQAPQPRMNSNTRAESEERVIWSSPFVGQQTSQAPTLQQQDPGAIDNPSPSSLVPLAMNTPGDMVFRPDLSLGK